MKKIILSAICFILFACVSVDADAASKTLNIPGPACQKGDDIYYCYTMGGLRMDLCKINVKTNKVTKVVSYKNKGQDTNGFFDLNIKGNSIYASYDLVCGTGSSNSYICKIDIKKKTKKKLTKGRNPIVIGKKIYYIKTKYNRKYDEDVDLGIYTMNLSGKKIKKLCKLPKKYIYDFGTDGKNLVYSYYNNKGNIVYGSLTKKGKKAGKVKIIESNYCRSDNGCQKTVGNYTYYISGKQIIRRNNTTQEKTVVIDFGNGDYANIQTFQIFGNVAMVRGSRQEYISEFGYEGAKGYIYIIHLDELMHIPLTTYNCGE